MKKLISLLALAAASIISINAQNVKMHRGAMPLRAQCTTQRVTALLSRASV